jgi:hypothetical protein
MEPFMRLTALILPFALVACTQFPELDSVTPGFGEDVKYPSLVPVETLLVQNRSTSPAPEQTVANLNARIAALQNRAARMRGAVVDANTVRRMQNGVK